MDYESNVEEAYVKARKFAEAFNGLAGEEAQDELAGTMARLMLLPEARATLVMQLLLEENTDVENGVNRGGKEFALRLAEKMGPDWAQWLYKFAVLVTKLA